MENFLVRLKKIIPVEQYAAVEASFREPTNIGLRLNTLKCTDSSLLENLTDNSLQTTPWPNVYTCNNTYRDALTYSEAFQQGLFYIQDVASMLPVLLLDLQPQQKILDLCAAPGSKTTQMAALLNNDADIAAVERNKKRFFRLEDNLVRQGVTCVKTFLRDGKTVYRHCTEQFDRVLIDAPCSSETRFDWNDPHSTNFWNEKDLKRNARDQWQLLYSGFVSLKPGGKLIYSTCTFSPEENELVVAKLFKKFPDNAKLLPITLPLDNTQPGLTQWQDKQLDSRLRNCLRILPNQMMSGFFMTLIQRE